MEKIVIVSPGGYEKLQLKTFPDPSPGENEVLIRTSAIGVNYADCCVRWGVYESAKQYVGWPITPGFEFSGTVLKVGSRVENIQVGQRVFGITLFNGYSSHIIVRSKYVYPVPDHLTMEEAGGFPAVFLTAYHAIFQNVRVYPGGTALIHSAAGGVGSALVQLSKIAQLKSIAVVGAPHKVAYVKELGANVIIDKSSQELWDEVEKAAPKGVDVIFDANGPATLKEGYDHLRPTGKLISYGFHSMLPKHGGKLKYLNAALGLIRMPRFNPLKMTNENKGVVCFNLSFLFDRDELLAEGMNDLLKWIKERKIRPPKVTPYALKDVAEAHKKIESGTSVGKLVLIS